MIYQNEYLNEISFPLGGIGTGSIGLAGNGEFVDWEIFNHPAKTTINPYTHFAVRAEYPDGRVDVRVLQGDHKRNLNGQIGFERFHAYGFGPHSGTMAAFPHFGKVTFDGRFPIAALTLEDEGFPAEIVLTAYNPMIPHEADDSSLPVAMFDVALKSRVEGVRYTLMLTVRNPFGSTINEDVSTEGVCAVMMKHAGKMTDEKDYGDLCVATSGADAFTHPYWYRGQWKDGLETYWRELTEGNLTCRSYDAPAVGDVCGVGCHGVPRVGEEWRVPFVLSWNIPNCYNYWNPWRDENGRDVTWKNYYATRFEDSAATARYALAAR
jgi:uncharacterized protein (DUF608 family)